MFAVPRAAEDAEPGGVAPTIDRQKASCADGSHSGYRGDLFADEAIQCDPLRLLGVGSDWRGNHERGDVLGIHAGVDVKQAEEAFAEQAGDDEQDDGSGEFEDNEFGAHAAPSASGGAA